ncbi:MAG TPA: phosphoribosyltransferase family protein [Thermoanaerobaculia bacterium]|nr:phosphoribosyltransferase family protein [Thermoanaerobaculia bacterium]
MGRIVFEEVYAAKVTSVWLHRLGEALAAVFPTGCVGCGAALPWVAPLALCAACRPRVRAPGSPACRGCGRPMLGAAPTEPGPLCGACRNRPPPWESLVAAYLYLPPLTGVVRALKFGRGEHLGEALSPALAARCAPWASRIDVVTPVPLPWTRLLARGYNQAEAVARPLSRALDLPVRPLLRRRPRPRQALLSRAERRRNLRGAFTSRRRLAAGTRVLLVDDVMTTGATLVAAARALRRAGADTVHAAVVARTPDASWGEPER